MKRPIGRLTKTQEEHVGQLAGTMYIKDLARVVGTSDSNLDRWAKQNNVNINALQYRPQVIKAVCSYYEKHGKIKTQRAFPDVRVRSIVEKYKLFSPRNEKWTDKQIVELIRMGGLITPSAQAKYFKRPGCNAGGVNAFWVKRVSFRGGSINGMVHNHAKHLISVKGRYLKPLSESRDGKAIEFRRLILWVDMEKCLKPEVPEFIASSIKTMADFQRWIWKSENPKPLILKMIRDREL